MTLRDKALAAVREEISRQIMADAKIPTIETLVDIVGAVYLDAAIALIEGNPADWVFLVEDLRGLKQCSV